MTDTAYRFLPWSRRGLAAATPSSPDGATVPPRAHIDVQVVVAGLTDPVSTGTTLTGPGDVVGLDPSTIVRVVPRPDATNVEPNYLVAVDFDQPELPWLFTPTGVPPSGRLKPWLVLVVVEDRPGVTVTVPPGSVLPHLKIESGADKELPDLGESWAWAHAQALDTEAGATEASIGQALADHPDHNVSRLVCPRRLEPGVRYFACLVPAWDAGRDRGLGVVPKQTELKPAWQHDDAIELPVYFHWQFQTGPQGDFESLARRLKPYEASARIGRARMHIGAASPFLPMLDGDARFLDMDGALQAPAKARETAVPPVSPPALDDVPKPLRQGLEAVSALLADAADGKLDGQAPDDSDALGPPVYAGAHLRRTTVTDDDPTWFRELNTDPRGRVAAGLGAEVLRTFQDDVMDACWQQVGDVVSTEVSLSRARLSLELGRRFTDRYLQPLRPGRFLQVAGPLLGRTLLGAATIPSAVAPTSFPDRTDDAALRRMTAARGRVLGGVARKARARGEAAVVPATAALGETLVSSLAGGRDDVDASRFAVPALDGPLAAVPNAGSDGTVSLERFGLAVTVDKAGATALRKAAGDLADAGDPSPAESMRVRADLATTGLLTESHLEAAREIGRVQLDSDVEVGGSIELSDRVKALPSSVLDSVFTAALGGAADSGFAVLTGRDVSVLPLTVRGGGEVVVSNPGGVANVPVLKVDPRLALTERHLGDVVGALPANSIPPLTVRRGTGVVLAPQQIASVTRAAGGIAVSRVLAEAGADDHAAAGVEIPVGAVAGAFQDHADAAGVTTITMPPLVKDAGVLVRYQVAVEAVVSTTSLAADPPAQHVVAFPLDSAVTAIRVRSDPDTVHPARLSTMVSIAGVPLAELLANPELAPSWLLAPLADRVMAYPRLESPAYHSLAAYDRTRFCPGIDEVPPESITMLETNPRFIAAFMGGLNHETNRELLWRGFPSDGRGTPWRKFWQRTDDGPDIYEMHTWGVHAGRDDLPGQTTDPVSNLVLLIRGDLLRRYPRTMVIAVKAASDQVPSALPADLRVPVFAGTFDPDVSFFGFDLHDSDVEDGAGWFFGLMEPVTEPRFGFDETVGRTTVSPTTWNDVAWPDLGIAPGGQLTVAALSGVGLGMVRSADVVAAAGFQHPFKLLVNGKHLVKGI